MTPHPQREYIIDDWMLQVWRTGCVNLSNPYTDNDKCRNCQYRGKGARERCCDFDDDSMQKIFQSCPHSSQQSERDKMLKLLEDLKTAFYKYEMDVYDPDFSTPSSHRILMQRMENIIEELRSKGEQG